jgi:gamma-glutamyltranspeptidase/glutathione hydrolase
MMVNKWKWSEELIKSASPNAAAMLLNGRAPSPGEVMRFPDLANTFKLLVQNEKPGYYSGTVATSIVDLISSKGGVMTKEDLASHESTFVDPISITYKGVTLYEVNRIFTFSAVAVTVITSA